MKGELSASEQEKPMGPLADRLDASIGETSSGIGALLSELVRRSLRAGVTDIGESLVGYAEEQVEIAVQRQMPSIAEAADAVAESTSKRIVSKAVDEIQERTDRQKEDLESKIESAESRAFDRSCSRIDEVVTQVSHAIDETRSMAAESKDTSEKKIQELSERAKQSWRKLVGQFDSISQVHEQLRHQHADLLAKHEELGQRHESLQSQFAELQAQNQRAVEVIRDLQSKLEASIGASESRHGEWTQQATALADRLAILEQPRGLKALFAKFQRNRDGGEAESE